MAENTQTLDPAWGSCQGHPPNSAPGGEIWYQVSPGKNQVENAHMYQLQSPLSRPEGVEDWMTEVWQGKENLASWPKSGFPAERKLRLPEL